MTVTIGRRELLVALGGAVVAWPLAVLMPRRLSASAAARVERWAVSAIADRTASARAAVVRCLASAMR